MFRITLCNMCIPFLFFYTAACVHNVRGHPKGENDMWQGNQWGRETRDSEEIMYVGLGGCIACNAHQ